MRRDYAALTPAPIHVVRHGRGSGEGPPRRTASTSGDWLVGFAGSMYSDCAWRAFLAALDSVEWRVAGRAVRLKVLASSIKLQSRRAATVEYLGFRPPAEVQQILEGCDLCYMPQPFVSRLQDLTTYSFPTKLGDYVATGRPVFVHSPAYSELQSFCANAPPGVACDSLQPEGIVAALKSLLEDSAAYARASARAADLSASEFSRAAFLDSVDRFLDLGPRETPALEFVA
jgi:hypothetical protein